MSEQSVGERVIRDVETNASEARSALDKTLVGYFVPIDQWRALRALLRTMTATPTDQPEEVRCGGEEEA